MKTRNALALSACLSLVSLGVSAQTVVEGDVESSGDGYVNAGGMVLKTGLGECLQTGTFSDDNQINKCAGIEDAVAEEVVTEVETLQAAVEPEPVPAPTARIDTRQFSEEALFEFDSATLTADGRNVMGNLFDAMSEYKGITDVSITGHTDSIGDDTYNQALSEQRAAAVAAEVGTQYPDASIDVTGMGESAPVASNDTAEGRSQNRRVEVEVTATRMTFN